MRHSKRTRVLGFIALALASATTAQIPGSHSARLPGTARVPYFRLLGEVVIGFQDDDPAGIHAEGNTVLCSIRTSPDDTSRQILVDVTNPAAPLACSALTLTFPQPQPTEGYLYQGIWYTGHHDGPPRATPVLSMSCGAPAIFGNTASDLGPNVNYHRKGWAGFHDTDTGFDYVACSIGWTTSHGGGLVLYRAGGGLDSTDRVILWNVDGGDIVISPSGNWCWQLDSGRRIGAFVGIGLNVWNLSDVNDLRLVRRIVLGTQSSFGLPENDLVLHPNGELLYAAAYEDGLKLIDISIPNDPILVNTVLTSYDVEGVSIYREDYLLVQARTPGFNSHQYVVILDARDPLAPTELGFFPLNSFGPGVPAFGETVHDMCVVGKRVYLAREDVEDRAVLQIWE